MNHALRFTLPPLISLVCGLAPAAIAQETEQEAANWFQVEMIVFSRENAVDGAEQWPRNLQLRYPFNWVELKDAPGDQSREQPEEELPSWDRGLARLEQAKKTDNTLYRLPEEERSMDRYANAMARSGEYRILFHEAWRQAMVERENSPAILITGGEAFGKHYELEGSVTLTVSRYLHLYTRLWLTEFEPNFGQPPGAWPELPRRPNQPLPEGATPVTSSPAPSWSGTEWDQDWGGGNAWDSSLNTTSSQPDFLGKEYLPSRIVTMTQQRRMRSEELHYIDHPLFGLLIKIIPYEPEAENGTSSP
ncbi:CsiV family protein [Marinimicrobium agarilyticum]|uniref:CsiV family protein n=1 Tax=Marinimicrobium agarilyticum TaxID=306546 RepID=UPI000423BA9E|nr:CsiV family protein [Marinimicrobium agarilyticum]